MGKSNTICILPWIHIHALPDAKILPCCLTPYNEDFGSGKNQKIDEIINHEKFKALRSEMLANKRPKVCSKCFELEDQGIKSLRQHMNDSFKHSNVIVENTAIDGKIENFKLRYLDIRFSNICNFKCRGCSSVLSSSWIEDEKKLSPIKSFFKEPKVNKIANESPFMQELVNQIDHLEEVYFAGGEPLISDEHFYFLKKLIDQGKTDIRLRYNTNLSVLQKNNYELVSLWKNFSHIKMDLSLDDINERGEYFRKGLNYKVFLKNVNFLKENLSNLEISITCTISLFNIGFIPEIHRELLQLKIVNKDNFIFNTLQSPQIYRTQVIPLSNKKIVEEKLKTYMNELDENFKKFKEHLTWQIQYMNSKDLSHLFKKFLKYNGKLDIIRDEKLANIYPELSEWK